MKFSLGYSPKFLVVLYNLSEIFIRNCPKSLNFGSKFSVPKLNCPKFFGINVFHGATSTHFLCMKFTLASSVFGQGGIQVCSMTFLCN